jgi:hypothetical protein
MRTLTPIAGLVLAAAAFPAAVLAQPPETAPEPSVAVSRACAAAGGLAAFKELGTIQIEMSREEVTQAGSVQKSTRTLYLQAPGPVPGRLEDPAVKVVAGDDGSGGWALVGGQVDARPSTVVMVRRLIVSNLFSALLPFSLTWDGVTVTGVTAAQLDGTPTWRLNVEMERSFFHTPQMATSWTVDLDRQTFRVIRAESPFTDLGQGITADGMRFIWSEPVRLGGVTFNSMQRVIGLDATGREKSHSRIDRHRFTAVPADRQAALFSNPVPPDKRPTVPALQAPPRPTT